MCAAQQMYLLHTTTINLKYTKFEKQKKKNQNTCAKIVSFFIEIISKKEKIAINLCQLISIFQLNCLNNRKKIITNLEISN